MTVKLLTEQHLKFLSLKGGYAGSSESTLVKIPHCLKSHITAHLWCRIAVAPEIVPTGCCLYSSCCNNNVLVPPEPVCVPGKHNLSVFESHVQGGIADYITSSVRPCSFIILPIVPNSEKKV